MTTDVVEPEPVAPVGGVFGVRGVLAVEGVDTGDCRGFEPNALRWDPEPIPLEWGYTGQHDPTRHVGWVNPVRNGDVIEWTGEAFDPEFIEYLKSAGRCGGSIVCDDETYTVTLPENFEEPVPGVPAESMCAMMSFTDARIRAFTVLTVGAISQAYIEPADAPAPQTGEEAVASAGVESGGVTAASSPETLTHAGILLVAEDTGRWLLLQRALEEGDVNGGLWEFPGGGLEDAETPLEGASREFAEEVGVPLPPDARERGSVDSSDGVYRLHVLSTAGEGTIDIDASEVVNPDDPDGDMTEAVAWWMPEHVTSGGYHIRAEVQMTDWAAVEAALNEETDMADLEPADAMLPEADDDATEVAPTEGLTEADTTYLVSLQEHHADIADEAAAFLESNPDSTIAEKVAAIRDEVTASAEWIDGMMNPIEAPTEEDVLIASAGPLAPPDEWFEPMEFDGPTPLTITADGRVFGHLATWNSCHRSEKFARRGECVSPPSDPEAPVFHLGQVITASGAMINVGRITVGGGHADLRGNLTAALEHYDDASSVVAAVRAVEDAHGIGLYGAVVPEATPEQVAAARRSPLSGDWRKERGKYRLIAAHAVVVPGFPVTRSLVASVSPEAFVTNGRVEKCDECGEERETAAPSALVASVFREAVRSDFNKAASEMRENYSAGLRSMSGTIGAMTKAVD